MKIANYYNQDRVAEATAIKRLIDKYKVAVEVKRILVYREIRDIFQQVPEQYIIKRCNKRAKQVREIIDEQSENNNI